MLKETVKKFKGFFILITFTCLGLWGFFTFFSRTIENTISGGNTTDVTGGEKTAAAVIIHKTDNIQPNNQRKEEEKIEQNKKKAFEDKKHADTDEEERENNKEDKSKYSQKKNLREDYQNAGVEFLAKGRGMEDLPDLKGVSSSLEEYLAFTKIANFRFLIFSREKNAYEGEIIFSNSLTPVFRSLDNMDLKNYSQRGRIIENVDLLNRIEGILTKHEITDVDIYAIVPLNFDRYMIGKILKIIGDNMDDIAWIEVRFIKRGLSPVMKVNKIMHRDGTSIAVQDPEV